MASPTSPEHARRMMELSFKAALKKEAEGDHDKAEHFLNKAVEYETEAKQMEGGA